MKRLATVALLLLLSAAAYGQKGKPCEELKEEIAKKLEANGVESYALEIVAKDKEAEGKVVGTCEGGTKKVVYRRTSSSSPTPAPEAKKP